MTRWISLIAIVAIVCGAGLAHADTWGTLSIGSWSPLKFIDDPSGDQTGADGRDIYSGVFYQKDDNYHYFRMDLEGSPSNNTGDTDWTTIYGIYINDTSGGPNGADEAYVPDAFDGVDYIVDAHFSDAIGFDGSGVDTGLGLTDVHLHRWTGSGYSVTNLLSNPTTDTDYYFQFDNANLGRLEWRVPLANITNPAFGFCGATHQNLGSTWDTTDCERVPEPTTMALMGLGIAGLAVYRRRRKSD